ncbi:hypothetical protein FSP39_023952 [Pinctada imbricata]|uniref:Uncharacterized protein n=1 Tax=Pinctada imbricata TaxID=66713 RepID=A0AA88Y9F2_PINIB|nr:hypothetical protein FSP39_023952 [Pinctada imbricata]
MTPDGGLKKLTEKQLQSVWDNGEFDVDSINFPGQYHRWRLTQLLQKGSKRARDTMLKDISLSLRLLIITARNRFISHFFSLSQSLTGWAKGLWKLLDILIGLPSTSPGDLHSKIQDEHMRYLVAELNTKPHMKKELDTFCRYVKEMCEKLQEETGQTTALKPPPIPYLYQTPKGQEIDLRLFNKDLINNCLPILSSILDRGARGWHVQYRQKLIRELQAIIHLHVSFQRVNVAIMDEYLDRVFGAITSNTELENLQPGIGKLLVDQAKSVIAMKKAVKNVQSKMASHKENLLSHLKTSYPVRSRIDAWTNEQIRAFENEFILRNLWSAHEEAISLCEEQGLMQAVYFLRRDLTFIKERETILIKELSKVRIPNRRYTFSTHIWLPRNYIVTKTTGSKKEVIPTVIRKLPPTQSPHDVDSYTLDRSYVRMTSSRYPFWRWWNYLQRSWKWTWNCMFFFGVVVPWCSPVSLRALLFIRPFFPDLALSKVDGSLYPSEMSKTETFISRLVKLWSHVRKSRQDFEAAPDRGFLGKSLTRHFNRFWNYVIKGSVGSVAICLFFPALCVLSSTASLTLAITAPAWVPVMTLFTQLFFFLVFDFDSPEDSNKISILFEALIWRILIQGCIQPIAAMLTGCIVCPLGALGTSLFGLICRTGRGLWDTIMFYTVIKSRGRVPINDGFIARRIAGPGLAADYFFQIRPEQAIAALECRLELDELEAWRNQLTKQIELPKEKYNKKTENAFLGMDIFLNQESLLAVDAFSRYGIMISPHFCSVYS